MHKEWTCCAIEVKDGISAEAEGTYVDMTQKPESEYVPAWPPEEQECLNEVEQGKHEQETDTCIYIVPKINKKW